MVCMHAMSSLLEKDKSQRIGAASFESFTDNPFFRELDFVDLVNKEIEPIFKPSSEKTNFDATYDLEELLLEEAPLEARTRKQKPRPELRADATEAEIRADELHRMIETMFEPFNYTTVPEQRYAALSTTPHRHLLTVIRNPVAIPGQPNTTSPRPATASRPGNEPPVHDYSGVQGSKSQSIPTPQSRTPHNASRTRSSTHSPNGSPPLHTNTLSSGLQPSTSPGRQHNFPPNVAGAQSEQGQGAPLQKIRTVRYDDVNPSLPPTSNPSSSSRHRPRGSTRSTSMSGGVQVVLNETGSWSEMANQSQSLVHEERPAKPSGMLGFLGRKKGRDRSPKAKERERGVLGKEGARVVVGN